MNDVFQISVILNFRNWRWQGIFFVWTTIFFPKISRKSFWKWNVVTGLQKGNFEVMPLTDFWEKYVHIYKSVGAVAIRILMDLHERKLLFFLVIKTKHRDKLDQSTPPIITTPRYLVKVTSKIGKSRVIR